MVAQVGSAHLTLVPTPDPPQIGVQHFLVKADGVSSGQLAATRVTFAASMPSMAMTGTSGEARAIPGKPGQWLFDIPIAMATSWRIQLKFDGGVHGTASFDFAAAGQSAGAGAMAAMGGHESAWRTATIALAIILVVAAILIWRASVRDQTRPSAWLKPQTLAIIGGLMIIVIGLAVLQSRYSSPDMDMAAMSIIAGSAPVPVTLVSVSGTQANARIAAPGIVAPFYSQDIAARVPGVVTDVYVYDGDRVRKGQLLAALSEPELAAQASSAQADAAAQARTLTAAEIEARHHAPNAVLIAAADARAKGEQAQYWRDELTRETFLLKNGAVSPQEYQDERAQAAAAFSAATAAQTQLSDARAGVEMAQAQQAAAQERSLSSSASAQAQSVVAGYTSVTAPEDGLVVRRLVDPGTTVQAGTPLLHLAVTSRVRIQANIADTDARSIAVGTQLAATLPDGNTIHAAVTSVQPVGDAKTHTLMVEAIVDNPGGRLVPGTYVNISLAAMRSRTRGAVSIPSSAILGGAQQPAVWVDINGTAHRVQIQVLGDDGTSAFVKGDLKPGDRVVIDGAQDLSEGEAIAGVSPP